MLGIKKKAARIVSKEVLEEVKEVTPVFPAVFHRLRSTMRPSEVTWSKVFDEKGLERLK